MNLVEQTDILRSHILSFYQSDEALRGVSGTSLRHRDIVVEAIKGPLPLNTGHIFADAPALRFWPQLVSGAEPIFKDIVTAANEVVGHFHWRINQNYIGVYSDRFFDNECFVEVIGPNGLLLCDDCRLGFLILGEDIYYPSHNHEATELYHTVTGTGAWWQDGEGSPLEDEVLKPAGTAIYHEEWENHAMRTTEPLLNLWSWTGMIDGEAVPS